MRILEIMEQPETAPITPIILTIKPTTIMVPTMLFVIRQIMQTITIPVIPERIAI